MSKNWTGLLAIAAVAALIGGWWYLQPMEVAAPEAPPAQVAEQATPLEGIAAPEEGVSVDDQVSPEPRKFKVAPHAQAPAPKAIDAQLSVSDDTTITSNNVVKRVQLNFELAMDGEPVAAYFLTRARAHCVGVARNEEALEQSIQRANEWGQRMQERGQSEHVYELDHPGNIYFTDRKNRAHLQRWYHACQGVRALFTPDLHGELDRLAGQGHVVARYLYAMWRVSSHVPSMAFEQRLAWEAKAMEYSMANLEEGEALGLLAFGQSYMGSIFTSRDNDLSVSFNLAALNCGLEIRSLSDSLDGWINYIVNSGESGQNASAEYVVALSHHLGEYCGN